jgi:transposase
MSQSVHLGGVRSAPNAQIIFDRFHVQRLVRCARRSASRRGADPRRTKERSALKNTRFALLKNPWNLTDIEKTKLTELPKMNKRLYSAYLLKESFAAILSRSPSARYRADEAGGVDIVGHALGPQALRQGRRTITKHLDGIVAYVATGLSNARSGAPTVRCAPSARRSYGLHGASALIALIHLCCSDLRLQPVHVQPHFLET